MVFIAVWLLIASPQATLTRCASCHLANLAMVPGATHIGDWQRSAHAKRGVGCDQCHGGDPGTYEPRDAHRGVLGPTHPSSPVNRMNLTRTCARCHERNALAFATTLHSSLVEADEGRAPTCLTCHGVMAARVPSPETLAAKCAACHPPGSVRGQYPSLMRAALESLNVQRARADALEDTIDRLDEASVRVAMLITLYDTRTLLKEAVAAAHRLDPRTIAAQTAAAAARLDALDARVATGR
jgi:Cytochrome c554 and c-prime